MLIHVFLLMKNPGEWQNHKCTHFNIINIIWLPLCNPRCPGFYLPVAAEEESQDRFYIPCAGSHPRLLPAWQKSKSPSSQTRQTGTATRNSCALTQETSPQPHRTRWGRAACRQHRCPVPLGLPPRCPWLLLGFVLPPEQSVTGAIKPGNNSSSVLNVTESRLACSSILYFIHPFTPFLGKEKAGFASSRRETIKPIKLKLSKGH